MAVWALVAAVGAVVSLVGWAGFLRRYRRAEITGRYLLALTVGYASFVSYALLSALRPDTASGIVGVLLLLPAFVALVVVIRERRPAAHQPPSTR